MRDYPNMSYCMFENTLAAMRQCAEALQGALDNDEPLELNQYERRPFNAMFDMCETMLELLEQHQVMVDEHKEKESVE